MTTDMSASVSLVSESSLSALSHYAKDSYICTSTFWANLSFLVAGILYVWVSIWDLTSPLVPADDTTAPDTGWDLYNVVYVLAPFFYVVNGAIDVCFACAVRSKSLFGMSLLFGVAAILDLAGTLEYDAANPRESSILSTLAVHLYLVQAMIVLRLEIYNDYQSIVAKRLLKCGVALFLIGALIDVIISYFDMTKLPEYHVRIMEGFYLTSSLLWLIDAVLYILADVVGRSQSAHHEAINEQDPSEEITPTLSTEMEPVV